MPAKPLLIEILAYAPTAYYHCTQCEVAWRMMGVSNSFHQEQVDSSLPPDLAESYQQVSDWVREVFGIYGGQITARVIDAASIEGFMKTLKHHIRQYPTIIIDGKERFRSGQLPDASASIARRLLAMTGGA